LVGCSGAHKRTVFLKHWQNRVRLKSVRNCIGLSCPNFRLVTHYYATLYYLLDLGSDAECRFFRSAPTVEDP
jgi:hypothetical protein